MGNAPSEQLHALSGLQQQSAKPWTLDRVLEAQLVAAIALRTTAGNHLCCTPLVFPCPSAGPGGVVAASQLLQPADLPGLHHVPAAIHCWAYCVLQQLCQPVAGGAQALTGKQRATCLICDRLLRGGTCHVPVPFTPGTLLNDEVTCG